MSFRRRTTRQQPSDSGQTFVLVVIFIGIFVAGAIGFATDYTQLWAHRQIAQTAADAACQAGAADIFLQYQNPSATTAYGIDFGWIGTGYDCSTHATSPPCQYASLNGFSGSKVAVSFPSSISGAPSLSNFGTIPHPYIQVTVTDAVPLSFANLFIKTGSSTISATAACGLNPVAVPIPLVVLHHTASGAVTLSGNPDIQIFGGPNRSIQVDSSSSTALVAGGSSKIDLTQAGPAGTGADIGVFGNEPQPSATNVLLGTGTWVSPATPIGDPWITVAAPTNSGLAAGTATPVALGVNGCPDPVGCVEFSGGDYTSCSTGSIAPGAKACLMLPFGGANARFNIADRTRNFTYTVGTFILPTKNNPGNYYFKVTACGSPCTSADINNTVFPTIPPWPQTFGLTQTDGNVTWTNVGILSTTPNTAIFDPGLYYVGSHGLSLDSNSTVRVSTATGDSHEGVTFYFSTTTSLSVTANSGKASACTAAVMGTGTPNSCIVSYIVAGTNSSVATGSVPNRQLQCSVSGAAPVPGQVPSTIDGNILFGPCSGTYGSSDSKNRGFLFFQSRSAATSASWDGGGQFLLSGFMYFHQSSTYGSTLTLKGNSGAGAFTLGNIVTDQATLGGTSGLKMILNPAETFNVLLPQLLQ